MIYVRCQMFLIIFYVAEMAMYRAVVNLVDNTITTVLTKFGGFSPQLALASSPCIQNNNQVDYEILLRHGMQLLIAGP